jgi:hypothetical protein
MSFSLLCPQLFVRLDAAVAWCMAITTPRARPCGGLFCNIATYSAACPCAWAPRTPNDCNTEIS